MKDFFKPEDFEDYDSYLRYNLCRDVNEKLNKLIESWPVVQGRFDSKLGVCSPLGQIECDSDTHTARLAFIEEIKKEPCVHTPYRLAQAEDAWRCGTCGVSLVPEWREVKR